MKKIIKATAILLGSFATVSSTTSCEKQECCTFRDYGTEYKFCENDRLGGYTWDYIKNLTDYYGGSCEDERI